MLVVAVHATSLFSSIFSFQIETDIPEYFIDAGNDITSVPMGIYTELGSNVGVKLGLKLGVKLGANVGLKLGSNVGIKLGANVGVKLGANVGQSVIK